MSVHSVFLSVIPRRFSIYREYAADRGASILTGDPATVANALETLATARDRPTDDLRQATDIRALCLIPDGIDNEIEVGPIRQAIADGHRWIDAVLRAIPTGFVAHPPIETRIERLREMERKLEQQ